MASFVWFFLLTLICHVQCDGDKSFMADIYPGFGWDAMRYMEMTPIYDVSNFNSSPIYQSCIELVPVFENKIELGSSVIDMFDMRSTDFSSNKMISGSGGVLSINVKASYSHEYQRSKMEQGRQQTIMLRNQIDYVTVDVVLKPSCPLSPNVKKDLIKISKYINNEEYDLATYAAQVFIRQYGTHFTNRLYLGGSIIEEDYIKKSTYELIESEKRGYQAAAEASFLTTFSVEAKYSSNTNNTNITEYKKQISRKIISSKGGKISLANLSMDLWHSSVEQHPVIIRRSVENITFVIQSDQIPELSEIDLANVRSQIDEAISVYVEMNAIKGCMNRTSPSFNWFADVDDGSCEPADENMKFGGLIRTCEEEDGMYRKCGTYRVNNFYTNTDSCPSGFLKSLLHEATQVENKFRRECESCGFMWLSTCCRDVVIGVGKRKLALYSCTSELRQKRSPSGILRIDQTYVFGGSFTSTKYNPVTNALNCPGNQFPKTNKIDDIQLCLAERVTDAESLNLPNFGGTFSCNQGNPATLSNIRECLPGYTAYVMGTVHGDCVLYVCLDFEKFDAGQQFPNIVLPPFFSIDIRNQTKYNANDTDNIPRPPASKAASGSLNNRGVTFGLVVPIILIGIQNWYLLFSYE